MSAPTPGPWRIEADPPTRCGGPRIVYGAGPNARRVAVADLWDVDGFVGSTEANACLIAAAPQLLTALRAMIEENEPAREDSPRRASWECARAALAQAEGRTP